MSDTRLFGAITVFATILAVCGILLHNGKPHTGLSVLLSHPCQEIGDGRPVLIWYRLDHSSLVNGRYQPVRGDLRREIKTIMATRQERIVYLAAESRLNYSDAVDLISDLEHDDPTLNVALLTKGQVDPRGYLLPAHRTDLCF